MKVLNYLQDQSLRTAALATAAAVLLTSVGVTAIRSNGAPPVVAGPAASGPTTAEAQARAEARATGRAVPVDAETTATSSVVANPNGSFTFTGTQLPTKVKRGDTWVPIDASLHPAADGSLVPAAVSSSVKVSGGGTAPLVTLADGAGRAFGFTLPMTLPKPTVNGATATYRSVLPGVDLILTTTITGGVREVLVVRDAAAAANPVLAELRLSTTAAGLTVSVGAAGNIVAADPATGARVFEAPPPMMWDSTLPGGVTHAGAADLTPTGDRIASSVDGPGRGATVTAIPDAFGDGMLTLHPPLAALTGRGVTYPLFIDPSITPTASPDGYTQSNHTTRVEYNPTDDLKVGNDDWTTNCGSPCYINGVTRSYLNYSGLAVLHGRTIESALVQLHQIRVSCSGSTLDTIKVAITNGNTPFTSSTSWSNQPAPLTGTNQWNSKAMNRSANVDQAVPLTNVVTLGVITNNWSTLNLVMYAANESDHCIYRHFNLNPALVVVYWSTPNVPTALQQVNGGQNVPCNSTSPGPWIGAASGNQISLAMNVSTVDNDGKLTGHAAVSANGGPAVDHATAQVQAPATGGTPVAVNTALALTDGVSYSWTANTVLNAPAPSTTTLTSANSAACYFRYDASPPSAPVATSTAYPVNGPTTVTAGGSGTITLSATDAGSGIASYNYNVNGASLTASGEQNTTSTSLSVPLQSLHWGTNTVWLQAVDGAGNLSTVSAYSFLVQQSAFGAYTPGTAGDIDGDNKPDLVTVDAAGAIHLYSAPDSVTPNPTGNLTVDPNQYGGKVLIGPSSNARWAMPDSASAAGALVTHGGSFTGNNYDDLLVEQNGHLAVATNPGTGGTWTFATTDVVKPACATCATYNGQDWSSVTQMIAMPVGVAARPDLLTIEVVNGIGTLWLYTPVTGSYAYQAPVAVSTYTSAWHWDDVQLISAGPLPGTTGTTLWVKLTSTAQLYQFHNIEAGIAAPDSVKVAVGPPLNVYGLVTSVGRADANGALPLWTTDFNGALSILPTYTNSVSGVTTMFVAMAVSANGWAAHQVALGSNYWAYNNSGVGYDGSANNAYDAALFNGTSAYSATAMANATLNPDAVVNDGSGGCPAGWTTCATGVGAANTIYLSRGDGTFNAFTMPSPWAQRNDNYAALGQILPVPTPGTSGPAHTIRFLGSATTFAAGGESVPITITYTNGHTQTMTLRFGDWCAAPVAGNTVVATMDHRLTSTTGASQALSNYLFTNDETALLDNGSPLGPNVQIASLSLGVNQLVHIFAIAIN